VDQRLFTAHSNQSVDLPNSRLIAKSTAYAGETGSWKFRRIWPVVARLRKEKASASTVQSTDSYAEASDQLL
jgi:hypothetical protein